MVVQSFDHLEQIVAGRAHLEHDVPRDQQLDHVGVLQAPDTVPDPDCTEIDDRLADAVGPFGLAGVRDGR
jgi:hypothetical protein